MATYLGTHGSKIQNYTTDPDNPNTGEVWYNDTSNALKFQYPNTAGAWATGNNINNPRTKIGGTATGGFTTAIIMGGEIPAPAGAQSVDTETYNGTNWTEVNNLNSKRILSGGAGNQTAGLAMGGEPSSDATELWNGTNWTSVNSLNRSNAYGVGTGTQTSALYIGGEPFTGATESWNGTNWTEVADLATARRSLGGAGTNTAALAFGGGQPPTAATEEWNFTGGISTITTS